MRFFILVFFLFLLNTKCLFGNHIVGGEIEMKYVGDSLGDYRYQISLIQYFDCYQDGEVPLPNPGPDNSVTYSIFRASDGKLIENRLVIKGGCGDYQREKRYTCNIGEKWVVFL